MRPWGLSFPLADHMNRLLSGGIRSHLRALGLIESHSSLVFSLCVEIRHCQSILLVLMLEEMVCTETNAWEWVAVSNSSISSSHSQARVRQSMKLNGGLGYTVTQGIRLTLSIMAAAFPWPHDLKACGEIAPSMVSHGKDLKGWVRLEQTSLYVGSSDKL